MHVSNSAVCAALVASLLVASASAAAPAGQISTYACDNECKSCRKTAVAAAVLDSKNSAGTANMAFCTPGVDRINEQTQTDIRTPTALQASVDFHDRSGGNNGVAASGKRVAVNRGSATDVFVGRDAATSATGTQAATTEWIECAADTVAMDTVTVAVFRKGTSDCTLDREHKSYFIGYCYAGSSTKPFDSSDRTNGKAAPGSFKVAATDSTVTFTLYDDSNCVTEETPVANRVVAITKTCNTVTETTDALNDANIKQMLFVSKQTKSGVIRKIKSNFAADVSGDGLAFSTGEVPKTQTNAALACDSMPSPVAYDAGTNLVSALTTGTSQLSTLIQTATDAGKSYVDTSFEYQPRGVCSGDRNKKFIQVCPSGAVPSYTEAPTNPTTAPPNTTNATSSASAVSAVAAAFVAVACIFA